MVQTTFIRFLRVFFTLENLFLNTFKSIGKKSNFPPIHTLNKFSFNLFSSRSSSLTLRKTKKNLFYFVFELFNMRIYMIFVQFKDRSSGQAVASGYTEIFPYFRMRIQKKQRKLDKDVGCEN